jgi:ParB/RepB/Spo0J family partition protein
MDDNAPVVKMIAVNRVLPSRHQARKYFNEESMNGLIASIKQVGLLEPILVRVVPAPNPLPEGAGPGGEWYELICGERRLRAFKAGGIEFIPAIIVEVGDEGDAAVDGLVENAQSEGLNPMEEAEGFQHLRLINPEIWTHEKIAERVGRDRVYVTQSIGILQLPQSVKEYVFQNTLSRAHAIQLVRLGSDEQREEVSKTIISKNLSWNATRSLIDKMIENPEQNIKESGDIGGNAAPGGFRIVKSAKGIHIIGDYPEGVATDELAKGLKEAHKKWLKKQQGKVNTKSKLKPTTQAPEGTGINSDTPLSTQTASTDAGKATPTSSGQAGDSSQAAAEAERAREKAKLRNQAQPIIDDLNRKRQALIDKSDKDMERQIVETGQSRENLIKMIDEQIKRYKEKFGE